MKSIQECVGLQSTLNIFFFLVSDVSGCVSISAFPSLIGVPVSIASSTLGLKICAITVGIKKHKSIIKKKRKQLDKIVLLAKTKLNTIEVLITNV